MLPQTSGTTDCFSKRHPPLGSPFRNCGDRHLRFRPIVDAGYQARPGAIGEVGPEPVEHHGHAVAQANEKTDVHQSPQPPGGCAMQAYETEVDHRSLATDRSEAAEVLIVERTHIASIQNPRANDARNVRAALLRRRCQARHGLSTPAVRQRRVAYREYILATGY